MRNQTTFIRIAKLSLMSALMAGALVSHGASADELRPDRAYTINHGDQTLVVFYNATANGAYDMVTTIGSAHSGIPSVQYHASLLPGQQQRINFANIDQSVLEIARDADVVTMKISNQAARLSMTE